MIVEIKLKDDVLNRHLVNSLSIETFKNLLKTNPKLLLEQIEIWEQSMKNNSGENKNLDYTNYNYHP